MSKHTKQSLITNLQNYYKNNNKIPFISDENNGLPHFGIFKYHFGSYTAALEAAGLTKTSTKPCLYCNQAFEFKYAKQRFCSQSCSASYNNKLRSKKEPRKTHLQIGFEKFENGELVGYKAHRKYLTLTRGYKCEICSINTWRDMPLVLDVDHIDGNPDNNYPSNLRLLCPHCHSQTETYKSKNKNCNSDRRSRSRRKRYYAGASG